MKERRATSGLRQQELSRRRCCARGTLLLLFVLSAQLPAPYAQELSLPPAQTEATAERPHAPKSAQTPSPLRESDDLEVALQRRGYLNLHGLSLNAALFTISEQWNINIVAGNVDGTVNGVFKDAPLREILDSILLSNGYNYRVVGKSLVVSKTADLGPINPFFQSATIQVQSADVDEVVEGARLLSTPQGQVRALKSARSIVVLDFPDRVEMIRQFVSAVDGATVQGALAPELRARQPLDVAHFSTQFISATAAAQALQAVLSRDGRVGVLEKDDRLIITDYAENLAVVEKVLLRIDQPRPQVRISAFIYDISLQDLDSLGLNWSKIGYHSSDSSGGGLAAGTSPFNTLQLADGAITSVAGGPSNIAVGTLSRHIDINVVLNALQKAQDARLLAHPNVAVLQNERAEFRSVREIPIQQLTETQQGGNIGTTAFRDAGIKLTVTPKIACDDTILMEVAPEFSRHVGNDDNGQPIIDTREAKTILRVGNRQTVVIGGLRQRDDVGEFSGIPYLKDMKYVGRLFRSRSTVVRESELVVFILPEIIDCTAVVTCREKMAERTVKCRLDQIPEAEGCPPSCRRLPPETMLVPGDSDPLPVHGTEPSPEADDLPPLSAYHIPSAEFQFTAGQAPQVRTMVNDGRLRRLPSVVGESAIETNSQTADGASAVPVRR